MEEVFFCRDCKMTTEAVFDHATGDVICTECALVLDSHFIDDTPEWRSFSDSDSTDKDPMRVGQKTSILDDGFLTTLISHHHSSLPKYRLNKVHCPSSSILPQRSSLAPGFAAISNMAERLGLVESIKFRASEIYKKAEEQKSTKGKLHDAILAACLYIACCQQNTQRTIKEICSVANGITKKDFCKAKKHLDTQLEVEMLQVEVGALQPGNFMKRFCSYLGMNKQSVKAAQEAIEKIQNSDTIDIRRTPTSVAAAVIYIITQVSKETTKPILLQDISVATGAAEGTIRNAYNDLYPHLPTIIPSWFANIEDLHNVFQIPRRH